MTGSWLDQPPSQTRDCCKLGHAST